MQDLWIFHHSLFSDTLTQTFPKYANNFVWQPCRQHLRSSKKIIVLFARVRPISMIQIICNYQCHVFFEKNVLDHLQKTFHSRPSSLHADDLLKTSVVPDYSFWQHASQSDDQSHLQKRLSLEIVLFVRRLHERWQYNIKLLEVHQRSDGMEYTGILFSIREVI